MEITADRLVKAYVKIREERNRIAKEHDMKDAELKEQLEAIEHELLELCKTVGADSLKTQFGTVSRKVQKRFWTSDWHSFHKFVKENDALDLFERRISQTNMQQFLEENPDVLPQGLNVDSKYTVSIRRK
jgi:isocitrate dehydrogenase kinase/phosphatase